MLRVGAKRAMDRALRKHRFSAYYGGAHAVLITLSEWAYALSIWLKLKADKCSMWYTS